TSTANPAGMADGLPGSSASRASPMPTIVRFRAMNGRYFSDCGDEKPALLARRRKFGGNLADGGQCHSRLTCSFLCAVLRCPPFPTTPTNEWRRFVQDVDFIACCACSDSGCGGQR